LDTDASTQQYHTIRYKSYSIQLKTTGQLKLAQETVTEKTGI